jgi:hypothetical protein
MLDNEGQEMLDRDVVVVSALVNSSNNNSSSQPGPSNLKTEVVFQDAAEAVKKMAATTGEQPLSIGGDSTRNDKKTTTDSNICIIEKIPDLDLDERGGIIVGVDSFLSSSPTKAVATALAAVFNLSGGDMLEDRDFGPIADASKGGDDIGGGKSVESSAAALGAIWCDSGGGGSGKSGKEGGSDTVSEYLDAC